MEVSRADAGQGDRQRDRDGEKQLPEADLQRAYAAQTPPLQ